MEPLHIFIYNEIGSAGVTADQIKSQLDTNPQASEIIVHISSPGGEVFEGWTIGNILASSGKKLVARIEGLCASIATYIALQADTVVMAETGRFMIHNPQTGAQGDAKDMSNAQALLEGITDDLVRVYRAKTGLSEKEIRTMMDSETFMTPKEARDMGFVDSVVQPSKAVAYLDKKHISMKPQEKKQAEGILEKIGNLIASVTKGTETPKAVMVELADGDLIFVESEDGDLTGKAAFTVEDGERTDTPAPDGAHELTDGRILIVEAGIVTEIQEGSDVEALNKQIEDLKAELAKAVETNEKLKGTEETQQKALEAIIEEVDNLKKLTVGGSFEVPKAHITPPKPGSKATLATDKLGAWGQNLDINNAFKR